MLLRLLRLLPLRVRVLVLLQLLSSCCALQGRSHLLAHSLQLMLLLPLCRVLPWLLLLLQCLRRP
jgi:hypothetical protein